MGGGGLRILGHKKWHVWRRDNVERVLRDEREHAEQQRAARDAQRRHQHERRAEALGQQHERKETATATTTATHINFFQQEEEAHTRALLTGGDSQTGRTNQQQRQSETLGRQARLPWYATAHEAHEDDDRPRRGKSRAWAAEDPLVGMRPPREAQQKEDEDDEDARVRRRVEEKKRRREEKRRNDELEMAAAKKQKEMKRYKKRKHRYDDDDKGGARELMERLRREREEREAVERDRAERLMRGH